MLINNKLKILKAIRIFLLIIYIPLLSFYLGIVAPEYFACINRNSEGATGVDIWGNEVQCFGDSKAFGEIVFNFFSVIIGVFTVALVVIFLFIYRLKKVLPK